MTANSIVTKLQRLTGKLGLEGLGRPSWFFSMLFVVTLIIAKPIKISAQETQRQETQLQNTQRQNEQHQDEQHQDEQHQNDQRRDTQRIDAILSQIEQVGSTLDDISCQVVFTEDDQVNLTKRVKTGTIKLLLTDGDPMLAIHFSKSTVDGLLGKQEWYLLKGRWFYEVSERLEQITEREIALAGETIDLFDLEKTPFPMPFGQKKKQIIDNFDVTLVAPTANDPPHTDHLVCIPKANSRFRKRYDKLEFFVLRDLHLPRRVVITQNEGYEIRTADFPDLSPSSLNQNLSAKVFDQLPAWKNYKRVSEPVKRVP